MERRAWLNAITVTRDEKGRESVLRGQRLNYLVPVLFDEDPAPGGVSVILRGRKADAGERPLYPMQSDFQERVARLRWMDEERIDGCIMLPSLGVCGTRVRRMPEATFANLRAFNRWLEPVNGRYSADPYFDPLRGLVNEDPSGARVIREESKGTPTGAQIANVSSPARPCGSGECSFHLRPA